MKKCFIHKSTPVPEAGSGKSLLLIFGGWGSWPGLFSGYDYPDDTDVLLCYDYRDMDFDTALLDGYADIRVIAWSMGVWVASRVLSGYGTARRLPVAGSIAVNGTMFPVDDLRGIPVKIFEGTLENMSRPVLDKFIRRMCAGNLAEYRSRGPQRDADELKDELAALYSAVKEADREPDYEWTEAVIGLKDMIFPAENQRRAWAGTDIAGIDAPHYGRGLFEYALKIVDKPIMTGK